MTKIGSFWSLSKSSVASSGEISFNQCVQHDTRRNEAPFAIYTTVICRCKRKNVPGSNLYITFMSENWCHVRSITTNCRVKITNHGGQNSDLINKVDLVI